MNTIRRWVVVAAYNYLPWPVARRIIRLIEFSDGTYAVGWRWSKTSWGMRLRGRVR